MMVCRCDELFETMPCSVIDLPEMVNAPAPLANVMFVAVRSSMSLTLVVRVEPAKTYAFVDESVGALPPLQLELGFLVLHVLRFAPPSHVNVAASADVARATAARKANTVRTGDMKRP